MHPKAQLLALLAHAASLARFRAAARALGEGVAAESYFIRCAMLDADLMVPPGKEPAQLVRSLVQLGWQAWPAGVEGPKVGDIYLRLDEERKPDAMGFVGKLDVRGEFFTPVSVDEDPRWRIKLAEVSVWLRLPGG